MQKKVRLCRGCGKEGQLISGFCGECNGVGFISPAPRVPKNEEKSKVQIKHIAPRSDKRAAMEREYRALIKSFLKEKGEEHEDGLPRCEGKLKGCTGIANQVQHSQGRNNDRLLEVEFFKASCANCNLRAESHPLESQANGFSLLRGQKR